MPVLTRPLQGGSPGFPHAHRRLRVEAAGSTRAGPPPSVDGAGHVLLDSGEALRGTFAPAGVRLPIDHVVLTDRCANHWEALLPPQVLTIRREGPHCPVG